jgi:uncharacterized membrane protein (UPF0127 family)
MPWLVRGNDVLASLEVAGSFRARLVGLLGRDELDGVLLLRGARAVHTVGMRFPVDVAYCDGELKVLRTVTLARHRIDRPVWRARSAIEAEAGAFERWNLQVGDELEIRGLEGSDGRDGRNGRADGRGGRVDADPDGETGS